MRKKYKKTIGYEESVIITVVMSNTCAIRISSWNV
jgi:hypothetical protein